MSTTDGPCGELTPDTDLDRAVDRQDDWTGQDEARWRQELRDKTLAWLNQLFDEEAARTQAAIERAARDQLGGRRLVKELQTLSQQRTPAEQERIDVEMEVLADAVQALEEGRDAFARGDLDFAAARLRVAAAHGVGGAVAYLPVIYQRQHLDDLAAVWRTIAGHEGYDAEMLAAYADRRLTNVDPEGPPPSEQGVADT